MTSLTAARGAIISRILGMASPPNIMQPNSPVTKDPPRFVIQNAPQLIQTATIDGTTRADFEIMVRVETAAGEYGTDNDALVQALIDLFPVTARFDGVTILRAPDPRPSYVDGGLYVTPVYFRGFTSF